MKKNSIAYSVLVLILTSILASFLGFIILSVFGIVLKTSLYWVVYLVMALIFIVLIYNDAHKIGDRAASDEPQRAFKGEICAVLAAIPSVVLALFSYLTATGVIGSGVLVFEEPIAMLIYRIWNMPFRILFDYFEIYPELYFVPTAAMLVAAILGYHLGVKGIRLVDYLYYARDNEETED